VRLAQSRSRRGQSDDVAIRSGRERVLAQRSLRKYAQTLDALLCVFSGRTRHHERCIAGERSLIGVIGDQPCCEAVHHGPKHRKRIFGVRVETGLVAQAVVLVLRSRQSEDALKQIDVGLLGVGRDYRCPCFANKAIKLDETLPKHATWTLLAPAGARRWAAGGWKGLLPLLLSAATPSTAHKEVAS
jgi:hypothetical protein